MNDPVGSEDIIDLRPLHQLFGNIESFFFRCFQVLVYFDLQHRVHIEEIGKQNIYIINNFLEMRFGFFDRPEF